jgi:hypothetical protein
MRYFASILLTILFIPISAQPRKNHRVYLRHSKNDTMQVVKAYIDSLNVYKQRLDSLSTAADSLKSRSDYAYRLFVPLTFYHSPVSSAFSIDKMNDPERRAETEQVDRALMNVYLHRPDLVSEKETDIMSAPSIRHDVTDNPIRQKINFTQTVAPKVEEPVAAPVDIVVRRPNFWKFNGDSYLQLLQNYVTDNWYKGGENYYSMVGSITFNADYYNLSKLKVTNKVEMKLGFQTSQSDSLHKFKTNNDLIRYTGKVGYQASKRWYYTFQLLTYTQFARGYKSNDAKIYSDFLAPLDVNLSLGMDFNAETKNKKLTGTINLAPLAYNYRYVRHKDLATRYGITSGHRTLNDFGSEMTADLKWTPNSLAKWETRLYIYTTYHRTELEWENTITFTLSKYISAKVFLYPRFDDGSKRDDKHGYWQFKQYSSLGLAYSF